MLGMKACSLASYNTATHMLETVITLNRNPIVTNMPVLVRKDARTLIIISDQDEQTIIHDAESQEIETMTLKTTTIEEFDVKSKRMVKEWTVTRVRFVKQWL